MLKAETDNIWSCRKIWFHSLISLNHLWPWRPKSRLGSTHCLWGVTLQLPVSRKVSWCPSSFSHSDFCCTRSQRVWRTVCQRIKITTKMLWSLPPRQRMQSFSPTAARWRTLTICVIIEDRYETPLTIESHFNIKGQMRGIPEEMRKKHVFKMSSFVLFACSTSCTCRCGFGLGNGLMVGRGWTNKRKTLSRTDRI